MNFYLFQLVLVSSFILIHTQGASQVTDPKATEVWKPEPRVVKGIQFGSVPSDAIVLFDGSNTNAWVHEDGSAVKWLSNGESMTVVKGSGDIHTKEFFGDCQLHLEWATPTVIESEGQGRGNSGVYFQKLYEVQILDSYNNRTYSNGQAGAIYKQAIPLVNVMSPPGQWNTYDIIFKAPIFNSDGIKTSAAYITVIHNGVVVQNHTEIKGTTEYIGLPKNIAHGDSPLLLQDHDNPVQYRNIWIRRL